MLACSGRPTLRVACAAETWGQGGGLDPSGSPAWQRAVEAAQVDEAGTEVGRRWGGLQRQAPTPKSNKAAYTLCARGQACVRGSGASGGAAGWGMGPPTQPTTDMDRCRPCAAVGCEGVSTCAAGVGKACLLLMPHCAAAAAARLSPSTALLVQCSAVQCSAVQCSAGLS